MRTSHLRLLFLALLIAGASSALRRTALPGLVRPAGGLVALVGGSVIDGTGAAPRPGCTVLIEDQRIRAVGEGLAVPEGAEVVDVTGLTLVPGLIDMHGHLFTNVGAGMASQLVPFARLYLAGGVTSVFTAGEEDPEAALAFRDAQRAGEESGTRVYSAGPYMNHVGGVAGFMPGVAGADEARAKLREWKDRIDGVKVYMEITPEEFAAVIEEAHAAGLTVTGHLGSLTASQAIDLGIDRLEHGIYAMSEFGQPNPADPFDLEYLYGLAEIDFSTGVGAALIDKIVASGTVLDPTIVILESVFAGPLELVPDWQRYLAPPVAQQLGQVGQALRSLRAAALEPEEWDELVERVLDKQRELVRRVHQKGGKVVGGTDPVFADVLPGHGLHREAEHFVLAGLDELEAIRACSLSAAEALGLEAELGSIAPGKLADLVVVEGDPSTDIKALGRTRSVYQAGARFSPDELRASVVGKIQ
ncbi:MAG TPA: amidohydrolase family protein [Planctomycetota bacterium]